MKRLTNVEVTCWRYKKGVFSNHSLCSLRIPVVSKVTITHQGVNASEGAWHLVKGSVEAACFWHWHGSRGLHCTTRAPGRQADCPMSSGRWLPAFVYVSTFDLLGKWVTDAPMSLKGPYAHCSALENSRSLQGWRGETQCRLEPGSVSSGDQTCLCSFQSRRNTLLEEEEKPSSNPAHWSPWHNFQMVIFRFFWYSSS